MIRTANTETLFGFRLIRNLKVLTGGVLFAATAIMLLVLLAGCTKETSSESVEEIATQYYDSIQKKDYDKALSFYADDFFTLEPAAAWLNYLKHVNDTLGNLKKVKLKRKNVSTIFSGRRFVFVFSNQYEKGLAEETVIFFKHTSKPGVKILAHKIESTLLPSSRTRR